MFFDREIWLDQLRDLAPLPQLVTFSACNSIYSFLYEGDEHVGLASTCFIAGAGSVIGSLWPVLDRAAAEFMQLFYAYYFETGLPAKASAKAQRHLLESGAPLEHWAGFTCHGAP